MDIRYFILFDSTTGRIAQSVADTPESAQALADQLGLQVRETEAFVNPGQYYLDENDTLVAMPSRPSKQHQFDWQTKSWSRTVAFRQFPFVGVDQARAWGRQQIDAVAGAARARYITVAPGQDATYSAKYADARAYRAAGYPADATDYPWIKTEAETGELGYRAVADRILQLGDPWNVVIGPQIEGVRLMGKSQLTALNDIEAVVAHVLSVQAQLEAI